MAQLSVVTVHGDGCPAQALEGRGGGAGTGRSCSHTLSPAQQTAGCEGPTAPTWPLLQARFLSRLLDLTGLEVIALILLILIAHQEVFISGFSLS